MRQAGAILAEWQSDVVKPWAATDYAACDAALRYRDALDLFGLLVTLDGQPAGFLLASAIGADTAVIHFAKGARRFDGVFPFMFRQFTIAFPQYHWLNFEQDLGNPGFRQAKRAYSPLRLNRKFRIRLSGA